MPEDTPVSLESRVEEGEIDDEIENARKALNVAGVPPLTEDWIGLASTERR